MKKKRAMIAMSGGVDSSAAVFLMKEQGYSCIGVMMDLIEKNGTDAQDAKAVADAAGIPFILLPMREEFREKVVCDFVETYSRGLTPNPCIQCNRHLKFAGLLEEARKLGYDDVVTGHYARVTYDEASGRYELRKGIDPAKDQSYVLYNLTQDQLAHVHLPLGEYRKEEIREIALARGFVNAKKKDSQDICFIPDGDYAGFIERFSGKTWPEGDFVKPDGTVVGRHKGMIRYTIGQRRGLGISAPRSLYVYGKDVEHNRVIVCEEEDLRRSELTARDVNLIAMDRITEPISCTAKIRYHAKDAACTVTELADGRIKVVFQEPQKGVSPGQSVVLYDGDRVLGGGIIEA